MLCENCKQNEATVRYTQIVNGRKQEMRLCEKCSHELGIDNVINFNMPIDFSSFLGDLISDYEDTDFIPLLTNPKKLQCNNCNMSYEKFLSSGKLGCSECYKTFENQMDSVLNKIHGTNTCTHLQRKIDGTRDNLKPDIEETKVSKSEKLHENLKIAIKEERYEDAAKIRDEIKKEEGKNNE